MAPITRVPSRPRLMRPERSVMHSPRLTNRNGVETRMAPPNTASGMVQRPIVPSAIQDLHGSVRQAEPALQQTAAGADAAEQDRNGNDRQGILSRQESDEDARETITGGEIGVGAALHGGDLDHAGKAGRGACEKTDGHNQSADTEANDPGGANVAAGDAGGEA